MSVGMAKWLGPTGRVYATDIRAEQLAEIRAAVVQDALSNVVVLEGTESSTNLPSECCDAIFLRDVYHHLTRLTSSMSPCWPRSNRVAASQSSISRPNGARPSRRVYRTIGVVMAFPRRSSWRRSRAQAFGVSRQCRAGRQTTTGKCCSW